MKYKKCKKSWQIIENKDRVNKSSLNIANIISKANNKTIEKVIKTKLTVIDNSNNNMIFNYLKFINFVLIID